MSAHGAGEAMPAARVCGADDRGRAGFRGAAVPLRRDGGGKLIKFIPYPVGRGLFERGWGADFCQPNPRFPGLFARRRPGGGTLGAGALEMAGHRRRLDNRGGDPGRAQADQSRAGAHSRIGGGIARLFWAWFGLSGNVEAKRETSWCSGRWAAGWGPSGRTGRRSGKAWAPSSLPIGSCSWFRRSRSPRCFP